MAKPVAVKGYERSKDNFPRHGQQTGMFSCRNDRTMVDSTKSSEITVIRSTGIILKSILGVTVRRTKCYLWHSIALWILSFGLWQTAQAAVVADSALDFSGTQGNRGWRYGYSTSFVEFQNFGQRAYASNLETVWTTTSVDPYARIGAATVHPLDTQPVVRRWVSDTAQVVELSLAFARANYGGGAAGDGVDLYVHQNGQTIWTHPLEPSSSGGTAVVSNVTLGAGHILDFGVHPRGGSGYDLTRFTVQIRSVPYGVANVRASQRLGTKVIDITYDLSSSGGTNLAVAVDVSTNNGASFNLPAPSVTPANGFSTTPGNNRQITWNAGVDWNNHISSQLKFRVTAAGTISADSAAVTVDTRDTGNRPVVQDVISPYCNANRHAYFLNGVSLPLEFEVVPNWNGQTPGSIQFIGPSGTHTQSGTQTKRTYNVGTDFGVGNHLTVKLIAADGTESPPYQLNFDVIPVPSLLQALNIIFLQGKYSVQVKSEWPALSGGTSSVPNDGSGKEMPGCTGKPLLFATGFSFAGEVGVDGTWSATLDPGLDLPSKDWKWKTLGFEIAPSVYGGLEGHFQPGGWGIGGFAGFSVGLAVESPPFYFWQIPPVYGKWKLSLEQSVEGHVYYDSVDGLNLNGEFPGSLSLEGALGLGLDGITDVEVFLGGGPYWTFQWPSKPHLADLGVKLHGGIRWLVFLYSDEIMIERSWSFTSTGLRAPTPSGGLGTLRLPPLSEFKLMQRDYLPNSTPYSVFLKKEPGLLRWGDPVVAQVPLVLQTNIFPYSEPSLAVSGTNRMLLLVTDNTNRAPENRTEVIWSKWNGSAWINPTSVWNDASADFSPTVKLFPDGSALAVWANEKSVLTNGAPLDVALAGLEIAAACFDPTTELWTAGNLTSNDYLDRSPQLAAATNGKALLAWIQNTNNSVLGATNALNVVQARLWDGVSWQSAGTIGPDPGMLLWSTVAYNGTNGVFLAAIDSDDDQSTITNQELWGATFDGASWTPLARLTTNSVQDAKPQAVYDNAGRLVVVWYQDTNLVMRVGDLNLGSPTVVGQLNGASSQKDFHLATGPAGQISMVWEDLAADGTGPDPMLLNYDATLGAWSQPLRLLANTNQLERSFSGAYRDNGHLLMAYNNVNVTYDTNNVPQFGAVDLMFLDYSIGSDLAVSSGDISLSTNNPAPGQSVDLTAVVRNVGELAATNVPVVFFDGNPAGGGSLIGSTQMVAGVFPAGSNATVQVTWFVPQTTTNRTIYVVADPAQARPDRNRANNTATKSVLSADLQISDVTVLQPSVTNRILNARCVNAGVIPSGSAVDVVFHRWATNGPVLATVPIANLPTNGVYDASFEWNLAGVTFTNTFERVYVTVDAGNLVSEAVEGNNTRIVSVMTSLDSDSDGLLDGEEARYGTNPLLADSDSDGLSDGDEVNVYHTNPLLKDTDGDGMSDGAEIAAGTDPNSAASVFKILSVTRNSDGSVMLQWSSVTNKLYRLNRSTTASRGNYVTLTNAMPGTPPTNIYFDMKATNTTSLYWIEIP